MNLSLCVELQHVIEQARLSPESWDLLVITPSQSQDIVRGSEDLVTGAADGEGVRSPRSVFAFGLA